MGKNKVTIKQAREKICFVARELNDHDEKDLKLWFELNNAVAILDSIEEKLRGVL